MFRKSLLCVTAAAVLVWVGAVQAQTTYTETVSGSDSWNDPSNWSAGVPSGPIDVVIGTGTAKVNNSTTPTWSGTLTLNPNTKIYIDKTTNSWNALEGASTISMNSGSTIAVNTNHNFNFAPITLLGDAMIDSPFGASDWQKDHFSAITGAHKLTIDGFNGHEFWFDATNTFSELELVGQKDRYIVVGNAPGAFGTGNVTVINNGTATDSSTVIEINTNDVIADTATLTLNGAGWAGSTKGRYQGTYTILTMNADDTVNELWINGVQAPAGTYTGTPDTSDWIDGTGSLTVLSGPTVSNPTVTSIDDDVAGGPIYQDWTTVNYSVLFSNDMDETTIDASDFSSAGSSTGWSIGSITKVSTPPLPNAPSLFNVEVLLSSPTPGTLQLQINPGAVLQDVLGNPLDTSSAILDDTIITINTGNTPPSTLIGTASGNDSWNDPTNWNTGMVPFGPGAAIIDTGIIGKVDTTPPAYSGGLTMRENSQLIIYGSDAEPALGSGPISMEDGSVIIMRSNNGSTYTFTQDITVTGTATIKGGQSTSGHHCTRNFDGVISGTGTLVLDGVNNNTFNMNADNSFDGLVVKSTQNQGFRIEANVPGALGNGDVSIEAYATLIINAADVIDDTATLFLSGTKDSRRTAKLILNADETVADFWVDGIQMAPGTYDSTSGLVDIDGNPLISGTGILTVAPVAVLGGDFNLDAQVEQTDLNLLLQNWGATVVPPEWTAPFDGLVDQSELNELLQNWGTGVGAQAVGGETVVPEPATLGLLVLGGLVASRRRK